MHNYASKENINNNLKKNLAYLIKKYKIDNEILSKCTGLSTATIASLRSRNTNPTIMTLQPIAEFFNLSIDEIINHDCENISNQESTTYVQEIAQTISVPIIDIDTVQDWPYTIKLETAKPGDKTQFVNTENNISTISFALKLDSETLMPYYKKNTVFIIDPDKQSVDGNIVVVSLDKARPTYRQVYYDAGDCYFKPVNPEFGGMYHTRNYQIHGVIVRAIFDLI